MSVALAKTPHLSRPGKRSYAIHDAFTDGDETITNDDEKEKLENRRKMAEEEENLRRKTDVKADDSRRSFGGHLPSMTAQQLSEHYNNCLQLFNENKITMKNAFNLQLIDYMAMMLKKRDKQMDNFSVVSCTLDASTKIYAYRVDHVHSDALKMAGGLAAAEAQKKNKPSKDEDSDQDEDEDPNASKGKEDLVKKLKRKKKSKQRATIVTNVESLNRKTVELGSWSNRLFVEPGECSILSNATVVGPSCALQLNNETKYWVTNSGTKKNSIDKGVPLKLPDIPSSTKISETLDGFSMVNWDENDEFYNEEEDNAENPNESRFSMNNPDKNLIFDVNEPTQPIPDYEPDYLDDRPEDCDIDSDAEEVLGQERLKTARKSTKDVITDIQRLISSEPLEYSYFQNSLISLWRGPAHWKIKPTRLQDEEIKQGQQKKRDKMKKVKNQVEISFSGCVEKNSPDLSQSRQTQLTKVTILKWSKSRVTSSPDAHYNATTLFRLFLKPCFFVRPPAPIEEILSADIEDTFNKPFEEKTENIPDSGPEVTHIQNDENDVDMDNDDDDARSFNSLVPDDGEAANADAIAVEPNIIDAFVGDNLVEPPNKIAKLSIQYALRPKTVDMKKLKSAIWECISLQTDINKENTPKKSNSVEKKKVIKFSEIQTQISSFLPKKLVDDLNCSLSLVALLHIANEKNLCIQGLQDHSDLLISQG